jgi:hypothetical protein
METVERPMQGMDHIARHVVWDRQKFARERGHTTTGMSETGNDNEAIAMAECSVCKAQLKVAAHKGVALVIFDEMTVRDCQLS